MFTLASRFHLLVSPILFSSVSSFFITPSPRIIPSSSVLCRRVVVSSLCAAVGADSERSSPFTATAKTSTMTTATAVMDSDSPLITLPPLAPTAKRLFLVRHGEVINPGGSRTVYYGGMDVPLSPLGELEAQAAADFLLSSKISRVFSSPLSRAVYGAQQVVTKQRTTSSNALGGDDDSSDVVILEGFTELSRGDWCGLTKEEIGAENMARFDACDESVTPGGGGESYPALKRRVLQALEQALNMIAPGTAGCLVSHLQVTRCILSDALNIPTDQMVKLKVATASVTCIDYNGETATVQFQSYKPKTGLRASKDGAN